MSTFNGMVDEFPHIRIDYFRPHPERPNPLACFLSHVHSDHTRGLQSLRSPFVYCSSATREILLNIERCSQRINFSKGIVETREKTYKHLSKVLRPIPLGVPTEIRLTPQDAITVTLFDANHCPGSVMFLIQGNGKVILYTGDVRAEKWWLDSLIRHPVLIPYAHGDKTIDAMYLDTTFATNQNIYRNFPTKAEGITELLRKISKYPRDTLFYLRVRTFGYEDVWQALSTAFGSKIHVDRYQWGLFSSLCKKEIAALGASEGPALCGFDFGNERAAGCLSYGDDSQSRIHSCDPLCPQLSSKQFVILQPIVNRVTHGMEIPEVGLGGGQDDIFKTHELELPGEGTIERLEKKCFEFIKDPVCRAEAIATIACARENRSHTLVLDDYGIKDEGMFDLAGLLRRLSHGHKNMLDGLRNTDYSDKPQCTFPDLIKFPFSRHSSYSELCDLVRAFRPRDVIPCTVHEEEWSEEVSMGRLFGHICSDNIFRHDQYMMDSREQRRAKKSTRVRSKEARTGCDPISQEKPTVIHDNNGGEDPDATQQVRDNKQPPAKRARLDIDSSFEHSASQLIDLTTPDPCFLEKLPTPPPIDQSIESTVSITMSDSSLHPFETTISKDTQEYAVPPTESRKRLANELKTLRDDNQLNFRLITDSCPDFSIADEMSAASVATAMPRALPLLHWEDDVFGHPEMSFSHYYSQTCIPCSYPKEEGGEEPTDIPAVRDDLAPDEDANGKMTLSYQTSASPSQKSVITLSTIHFDSQETTLSPDGQPFKG
ncbi:hypothetical protein KEM54_002241, partial [Ascosphaera aggregata]